MKIRHGFVTNSSSSSFIVVFPSDIQGSEEVKQLLFGDQEYITSLYDCNEMISTDRIASTIWQDILRHNVISSIDELAAEINEGWIENMPELPRDTWMLDENKYNEIINAWEYARTDFAYDIAKEFLSKVDDSSTIYLLSYADGDGRYYGTLEHGNIFARVPHIRVNKH